MRGSLRVLTVPASNLREAIQAARALGFTVEWAHGSGDLKFAHPLLDRMLMVNGRRKDATRHLLAAIRRVEREQGATQ